MTTAEENNNDSHDEQDHAFMEIDKKLLHLFLSIRKLSSWNTRSIKSKAQDKNMKNKRN